MDIPYVAGLVISIIIIILAVLAIIFKQNIYKLMIKLYKRLIAPIVTKIEVVYKNVMTYIASFSNRTRDIIIMSFLLFLLLIFLTIGYFIVSYYINKYINSNDIQVLRKMQSSVFIQLIIYSLIFLNLLQYKYLIMLILAYYILLNNLFNKNYGTLYLISLFIGTLLTTFFYSILEKNLNDSEEKNGIEYKVYLIIFFSGFICFLMTNNDKPTNFVISNKFYALSVIYLSSIYFYFIYNFLFKNELFLIDKQ